MSETQAKNSAVRHQSIDREDAGQRIDNYLLRILKGVPRSYIYRILRKGEVRVNKKRVKAEYRLQDGDLVRIPPVRHGVQESVKAPPKVLENNLENTFVYEDNKLILLNKPSGIAVHGGSGLSFGVIETLRAMRPNERLMELVHRLDRETSGCLLIAKKRSTLRALHELIRENRMDKRYLALVAGRWEQDKVKVNQPLLKNSLKGGERVVRVDPEGKRAITHFRVIRRFSRATLVEVRLMTGRTHQIRVHAQYLDSPILGDRKYGDDSLNKEMRGLGLNRLFLHAASLRFQLPDEEQPRLYSAPIDPILEDLMERLP